MEFLGDLVWVNLCAPALNDLGGGKGAGHLLPASEMLTFLETQ